MEQIERIGISLEKKLLSKFDKLISEQGYQSRSEAIRDLIRRQINTEKLSRPNENAVAAVNLVYDHHSAKLMEKLVKLQHNHHLHTISSMHIHLNAHDCLEMIVLKGKVSKINKMAEEIISLKGVRSGSVNFIATE